MNTPAERATYALNEVLPAMRSGGFMLVTSSGPLHVPPGREAEQFADLLAHFQQLALIRAQCATELQQAQPSATSAQGERDAQGFSLCAGVIGAPAVHRPAEPPYPEDSNARSAAPESLLPCDPAQPDATPQTRGGHQ